MQIKVLSQTQDALEKTPGSRFATQTIHEQRTRTNIFRIPISRFVQDETAEIGGQIFSCAERTIKIR